MWEIIPKEKTVFEYQTRGKTNLEKERSKWGPEI